MLDYTIAFSLPKLVLDDELCGQALHFVGEVALVDDLPITDLVQEQLAKSNLLTAKHTLAHWRAPTVLARPQDLTVRSRDNSTNQAARR